MDELLQHLLSWVEANPGWAYLAVFLAALSESLAVIGVVVPGVMMMFGAGALIATGDLRFWPTCLAAIAGAVAGDGLSYWLGFHYRGRIRGWWPFRPYPEHLERGIAFFARHGTKSIVIGRFFGPVRAVVPLVAGMMQMAPRRFVIANVASAAAWGPVYLAPGIVFGASLKLAAEAAVRLVILMLILVGLIWLVVWIAREMFLLLSPRATLWLQGVLRWADVHPSIGRMAQALSDSSHPDAGTLTTLAGALLAATLVLGLAVGAGLFGAPDITPNTIVLRLGQSLHTPLADELMTALGRLGDPSILLALVLAVLLYLYWRKQRREAYYWLAVAAFALVATPLLGLILQVPRPEVGLVPPWPWSFPSAPVLGATLVYGFLAVAVSRGLPSRWRWVPYAMASVLVLSVALSRLYFGTEWLTDVVGSAALGLLWVSALGIAFRHHTRFDQNWGGLASVALATLCLGFALLSLVRHEADVERYTPRSAPQYIHGPDWHNGAAIASLPTRREELWHSGGHRLDLQYAGTLPELTRALERRGWKAAEGLSWGNAMRLLSPSLPLAELPVIPHVHNGRHEALHLVKDAADDIRVVLRLWATHYRLEDQTPLWVGDVTSITKESILGVMALPKTIPGHREAQSILERDLEAAHALEVQQRNGVLRLTARH